VKHITLVRHAQASFLEANYDQLCPNGEAQARLLGEYWLRRGMILHNVYSGPRTRQRETARIVADVYHAAGRSLPEIVVMNEFDEYQAEAVLRTSLPQLLRVNPGIREMSTAYESASAPDEPRRTFQRLFEAVIGKWVAGETAADGIESWPEFCLRVERGLLQVIHRTTPGVAAVVFTSSGPIAAAIRRALHLSAEDALELSWMSRNASFTDFRAAGERFRLSAFNAYPHLDEDSLLTYW
jgi:broad specificity phosphatase PhoE